MSTPAKIWLKGEFSGERMSISIALVRRSVCFSVGKILFQISAVRTGNVLYIVCRYIGHDERIIFHQEIMT